MSNITVAQNWRQQTNKGRNSENMFYEYETIYSYGYHFPMAYITGSLYRGISIVLQNSDNYSNTTARHLSHMRAQCFSDAIVEIPTRLLKQFVECLKYSEYDHIVELKKEAEEFINNRIEKSEAKLKRARTTKWLHEENIKNYKEQLIILSCI